MPGRKHPDAVKQQALVLAAGDSVLATSRQLNLPERTVNHWVKDADPGMMARLAAEKRALLQRTFLNQANQAVERIMSGLMTVPLETGKDLQAAATTYGILDDHHGGRQPPVGGTRFGTSNVLDGWTERDRITLERIERTERLTLERDVPEVQDPTRGTGT